LTILSILIFIFILGVLIAVHEFGHYIAAKKSGIRVTEFALGMGPKIWKRQKGETLYSLRAFPIGGFCSMGEDLDPDPEDKHAFPNAKRRKRALVLAAGSLMNFLLGFLILLGLCMSYPEGAVVFAEPVIGNVLTQSDDPNWTQRLEIGDRILRLNGHAIYHIGNFQLFLSLSKEDSLDLVVERDGQRVVLKDMQKTSFDGAMRYGFEYGARLKPATPGNRVAAAWHSSVDNARLVWVSLGELLGGRAKADELMGPVGMGGIVNEIVQREDQPVSEKTFNLLGFAALITINLAIFNLLPLPALDGGRLLFIAVEAVRRKKLNPKYEGYVHAAGFVLFIGLMIFVLFNDIMRVTGLK